MRRPPIAREEKVAEAEAVETFLKPLQEIKAALHLRTYLPQGMRPTPHGTARTLSPALLQELHHKLRGMAVQLLQLLLQVYFLRLPRSRPALWIHRCRRRFLA